MQRRCPHAPLANGTPQHWSSTVPAAEKRALRHSKDTAFGHGRWRPVTANRRVQLAPSINYFSLVSFFFTGTTVFEHSLVPPSQPPSPLHLDCKTSQHGWRLGRSKEPWSRTMARPCGFDSALPVPVFVDVRAPIACAPAALHLRGVSQ